MVQASEGVGLGLRVDGFRASQDLCVGFTEALKSRLQKVFSGWGFEVAFRSSNCLSAVSRRAECLGVMVSCRKNG